MKVPLICLFVAMDLVLLPWIFYASFRDVAGFRNWLRYTFKPDWRSKADGTLGEDQEYTARGSLFYMSVFMLIAFQWAAIEHFT